MNLMQMSGSTSPAETFDIYDQPNNFEIINSQSSNNFLYRRTEDNYELSPPNRNEIKVLSNDSKCMLDTNDSEVMRKAGVGVLFLVNCVNKNRKIGLISGPPSPEKKKRRFKSY